MLPVANITADEGTMRILCPSPPLFSNPATIVPQNLIQTTADPTSLVLVDLLLLYDEPAVDCSRHVTGRMMVCIYGILMYVYLYAGTVLPAPGHRAVEGGVPPSIIPTI